MAGTPARVPPRWAASVPRVKLGRDGGPSLFLIEAYDNDTGAGGEPRTLYRLWRRFSSVRKHVYEEVPPLADMMPDGAGEAPNFPDRNFSLLFKLSPAETEERRQELDEYFAALCKYAARSTEAPRVLALLEAFFTSEPVEVTHEGTTVDAIEPPTPPRSVTNVDGHTPDRAGTPTTPDGTARLGSTGAGDGPAPDHDSADGGRGSLRIRRPSGRGTGIAPASAPASAAAASSSTEATRTPPDAPPPSGKSTTGGGRRPRSATRRRGPGIAGGAAGAAVVALLAALSYNLGHYDPDSLNVCAEWGATAAFVVTYPVLGSGGIVYAVMYLPIAALNVWREMQAEAAAAARAAAEAAAEAEREVEEAANFIWSVIMFVPDLIMGFPGMVWRFITGIPGFLWAAITYIPELLGEAVMGTIHAAYVWVAEALHTAGLMLVDALMYVPRHLLLALEAGVLAAVDAAGHAVAAFVGVLPALLLVVVGLSLALQRGAGVKAGERIAGLVALFVAYSMSLHLAVLLDWHLPWPLACVLDFLGAAVSASGDCFRYWRAVASMDFVANVAALAEAVNETAAEEVTAAAVAAA